MIQIRSLVMRVAPFALAATFLLPVTTQAQGGGKNGKNDKPKPYAEVVTASAKSDSGMFNVHRVDEKLYFEIPDSLLGRDVLLVSRIAQVPSDLAGGFMAAGHKTGEQVLRWERVEDKILLRKISYQNVADESLPIHLSVVKNNFAPILASFKVEAEGPGGKKKEESRQARSSKSHRQSSGLVFAPDEPETDEDEDEEKPGSVVIDVTDFFTKDIPAISGLSSGIRETYRVGGVDKDRSFLNYAHAYPLNVDVRHTLTYRASRPPSDASAQTMSLEMHQSMVLLPEEPMRPRYNDKRVGYFTVSQINYGLDKQKAAEQTFIGRWRLEPKDPAAYARGELVEPVKPIVYYLDPATPEKWRDAVRQGIEDWQPAFETAGFKNAIIAKDPPTAEEDPDWTGEDVRYSMVRWAAREVRNAMGPSVWDPRSGEIIESDIVWYHNHMRSYRNRLMLETGAANPQARSLPIDEALMAEAMRAVIAHEVGHALGLPHNMIASSAYPVESLRDPDFARRMGVAPTIMDYARQNYIAQPGDGLQGTDFIRQIGPYDHYSINWGYRLLPEADTPEDEKPILHGWILERADDPMYRFSPQRGGAPVDPRAQTEDLGDDPVLASGYGMANLKRVTPRLVEWTSTPGENYEDLDELYGELVYQWYRYSRHVITVVGGVYEDLKSTDQSGPVYDPVPEEKQREAMRFLADEALSTPEWLNDPEILRRIEHAGAVDRIRRYQERLVGTLLDPARMQRLIEIETIEDTGAYSLVEFMDDMKDAVWGELATTTVVDTYRRNLQRAYLERLEWLFLEEAAQPVSDFLWVTLVDVSQADIRAVVRGQLGELRTEARRAAGRTQDRMTRLHWTDVAERVDVILERENQGE